MNALKAYEVIFGARHSVFAAAYTPDEAIRIAAVVLRSPGSAATSAIDVTDRLSRPSSSNSFDAARSIQMILRSGRTGHIREAGGGRIPISHYKPKDWINVQMGRPMPREPKTWELDPIRVERKLGDDREISR